MDRFDAMQAFARVVEAGSFTRAAETLHMSKTSVTQLVQQLEARLRVRLLNRTTRQVKVTADGAAYYERVLRVLADVDALDASGIAEQALLYAPTVSRILRELVDRGLIKREIDPNDGRRSIISITAEGHHLVRETAGHTGPLLVRYAEAFGEQRLRDFIAEAHALAVALEALRPRA